MADIALQAYERLGVAVACVATEHWNDILHTVAIAGKFVVPLCYVDSLMVYLLLALAD